MDKRYQVFISSTYQDLADARQEVSQALLEADCFPAGMELFPAADEEQFEYIKRVIDESDYYVLITAGRYGSLHPVTGLSYTEMEYDYAVATGKPVIRLLHKDPFNVLTGDRIEQSDAAREKLKAFRLKLRDGKLVKHWSKPEQLGQIVLQGLRYCIKHRPSIGWTRADRIASHEAELRIAELEKKNAHLELQMIKAQSEKFDAALEISHIPSLIRVGEIKKFPLRASFMILLSYIIRQPRANLAVRGASSSQKLLDFLNIDENDFDGCTHVFLCMETVLEMLIASEFVESNAKLDEEGYSYEEVRVRREVRTWLAAMHPLNEEKCFSLGLDVED